MDIIRDFLYCHTHLMNRILVYFRLSDWAIWYIDTHYLYLETMQYYGKTVDRYICIYLLFHNYKCKSWLSTICVCKLYSHKSVCIEKTRGKYNTLRQSKRNPPIQAEATISPLALFVTKMYTPSQVANEVFIRLVG